MTRANVVPAGSYPPTQWESGNRLIQPHRIGFKITSGDVPSSPPESFFPGPVHPWLLRLHPDNVESFRELRSVLGLHEFLLWTYEVPIPRWTRIVEALDTTGELPPTTELEAAWSHPSTVYEVANEVEELRHAYHAVADADTIEEAQIDVLNRLWRRGPFMVELDWEPLTATVYERPQTMWDRAWLELLHGLRGGRAAKPCMYCLNPFVPNRVNQRYCTGTNCTVRAYEQRRRGKRRAYNTDYQRARRRRQKKGRQ